MTYVPWTYILEKDIPKEELRVKYDIKGVEFSNNIQVGDSIIFPSSNYCKGIKGKHFLDDRINVGEVTYVMHKISPMTSNSDITTIECSRNKESSELEDFIKEHYPESKIY